jgi:hypothetical protein
MSKILTNKELDEFEKEINQINLTLSLCNECDQDIIDNLNNKLSEIINNLEKSLLYVKMKEKGFRVIK